MLAWKPLRMMLLATTFSGVFLVLLKSVFYPAESTSTVTPFAFPPTVPLQGWQPLTSDPLGDATPDRTHYIAGRRYQYIQNELPLAIEMRYFVDTGGEVKEFLKNHTSISVSPVLRQKEEIGFYGVFTHQEQAYLSACINPRGGSTLTARQFKQNRNAYDMQLSRLLPWLLGRENLKDERCLWTHLSIPLKDSSSEVAYQNLEDAWFSWYQWWQPRFPEP
jgi:cyanosortase A-associated protein